MNLKKSIACISINLILFIFFSLLKPENTYAGWYNENWSKRKAITIDNTSNSSSLSNYQVNINVSYDSDMNTDFSDLRFTDSDGTTEIDFWVQEYTDSTSATVWAEVPSISASTNETIYMYYGNSAANSVSDKNNTMIAADLFNDGSIDTKWIQYGDSGPWAETGGALRSNDTDSSAYSYMYYDNQTMSNTDSFIVESRIKYTNSAQWGGYLIFSDGVSHHHIDFNPSRYQDRASGTGSEQPPNPSVPQDGTWVDVELIYTPNTLKWYHNGTLAWTDSNTGTAGTSSGYFGIVSNYHYGYAYWDYIRVRQYTDPEPNINIEAEEIRGCPTTTTGTVEYDCSWENNLGTIEIDSVQKNIVGAQEVSDRLNTASITVPEGNSITVQSDQVAIVGSLDLSQNGSVVIIDGGQIKPGGVLSYEDKDQDGYAANFDKLIKTHDSGDFTPVSNILTTDFTDCNDNNVSVWASLSGYTDNDNDGYGTGAAQDLCTNGNLPSGYADNNNDIDDNNDCADNTTTHQCGDGDLDGTCTPVSAGENGLAACQRCNGSSIDPVNVSDDTQDTEGSNLCNQECKKCSGGSCVNQSEGEDLFSQCGIYCDGSGACSTCLPLANSCSSDGDCCSGYCEGGYCCSSSCTSDPCTDYTYSCNTDDLSRRYWERTCYTADCSSGSCQQNPNVESGSSTYTCHECDPDDPVNWANIAAGTDPYNQCTEGEYCNTGLCNGSGSCDGYNDGQKHGCGTCRGCFDNDRYCEYVTAGTDPFDECAPNSSDPCRSDYCGGSYKCDVYQNGEKGLCGNCFYCNDEDEWDCEDVTSGTDPNDDCPLEECMKGVCDWDETCEVADDGTDPGGYCQAQNSNYLCYRPSVSDDPVCADICTTNTNNPCDLGDQYFEVTCSGDTVFFVCNGSGWDTGYAFTPVFDTTMSNSDAENHCEGLDYAGYTDWVLVEDYYARDLCESDACEIDADGYITCFGRARKFDDMYYHTTGGYCGSLNRFGESSGEKYCRYYDDWPCSSYDNLHPFRCTRNWYTY